MKIGRYRYGVKGGRACLYFHGFPGSGVEPSFFGSFAKDKNLDIFSFDRPGYGETDPIRGYDYSAFYEQILSELPKEPIYVLGVSGGAPFAADFATRFGHRTEGLLLICPLAGLTVGSESFDSYPSQAQMALKFFSKMPDFVASNIFRLEAKRRKDVKAFLKRFKSRCPIIDQEALGEGEFFIPVVEKAKEQNFLGCISDLRFYMNWKPSSNISRDIPVYLFHGLADKTVPSKNTEVYLKYWPWATARFFPEDGHFSLPILRQEEIFQHVNS